MYLKENNVDCWLKNIVTTWNRVFFFFLVGMCSSKKTALRRKEGKSGYIQVCNKGNRQSEHQRSGVKLRNLTFFVREDASLWAHWIQSFHMNLSCLGRILFPCSCCFLHSPAPQQLLWGVAASAGSRFGEPSLTFGGQKSLMAVTFLVCWCGRRYFHSTWSYLRNEHVCLVLSHVQLCDPMNWSPPSSSVHGIFQASALEWVAISFSGSSRPRNRTRVSYVSCIGRQILYHWATWEAHLRNQ